MNAVDFCELYQAPTQDLSGATVTLTVGGVPRADADTVWFMAARPADRRASFAGSGLAFPSRAIALEGTPNRGSVRRTDGTYAIKVLYPNAYYDGRQYVPPSVHLLYYVDGQAVVKTVAIGDAIPHRDLIPRPPCRTEERWAVQSAEARLLRRAYPYPVFL